MLLLALPMLLLPRGYLWQWRHGLTHYAPITDPSLRYPGLLSWMGLALVILPWLARWIRVGRPTRPTPLDLPIGIYVATATLSLWPSVDRAQSLNALLTIVAGVAVYYGVVNAATDVRRWQRAVAVFMLGGVALTMFAFQAAGWDHFAGVVQLQPVYGWLAQLPNVWNRTVNVGIMASVVLLFAPLALALALATSILWRRIILLLVAVIMIGLPVLARSRGDVLALLLTLPALFLWRGRRGAAPVVAGVLGLCLAAVVLPLYAPGLASRLAFVYPSRWAVWERAAYILRDHPFTGIGLDIFPLVARVFYPYFDYAIERSEHAHTLLLQVGVDQGMPGLLAFAVLIILFYRANWHAWRAAGTREQRLLALGIFSSATAFLLGSAVDNGVMTSRAAPAFWCLLGLGAGQAQLAGAHASAPLPGRPPLARYTPALVSASAIAILLMALLVRGAWLHNLGNIARNRGWLGQDMDAAARARAGIEALADYDRAGDRAARNRGGLLLLAHHPAEALFQLSGKPTADERAATQAFMEPLAARTAPGQATVDLEAAVARYPLDRFAHLFLADAYRLDGRLREAATEYGRAGVPADWLAAEARRRWDWGRGDTQAAQAELDVANLLHPNAESPGLEESTP